MSVQNKLHDACKLQLINTIMTCEQFVPFTSLWMLRQYYAICHFEETNGSPTQSRDRRHRNLCDIENASQHYLGVVMYNAATEVSYRCEKSFELIIICLLIHPKIWYTFLVKQNTCVHRNNPLLSLNTLLHSGIYWFSIQEHSQVTI